MNLYEGLNNYLISQCYSKIQKYLRNVNLITQVILNNTVEKSRLIFVVVAINPPQRIFLPLIFKRKNGREGESQREMLM